MSEAEATPALRERRWFAFSLRAMFVVVTVLCCWLAWNLHVVQQRKQLRKWLTEERDVQLQTV